MQKFVKLSTFIKISICREIKFKKSTYLDVQMGNSLRMEVDQRRHCLQHVVPHRAFAITLLFANKAEKLGASHSAKTICQYICAIIF